MHAANVNKTEMHLLVMHNLLGETRMQINGVENYYDRGQKTNTTPAQGGTRQVSESP